MINESTRIKQAQDNFYQYCLNNLPVGRYITQEDRESIERVRMSNLKSREVLFGSKDWVWYLKEV